MTLARMLFRPFSAQSVVCQNHWRWMLRGLNHRFRFAFVFSFLSLFARLQQEIHRRAVIYVAPLKDCELIDRFQGWRASLSAVGQFLPDTDRYEESVK